MFEAGASTAIKICGVTCREDALVCAEAGVAMIGLNFSPKSARCIAPEVAEEIVCAVRALSPKLKFAGIFVNQEQTFVQQISAQLQLDSVQLHGDESPEYASSLQDVFVIKALRVGPSFSLGDAANFPCDAVLLDSWSPRVAGGTGETFPWPTAAALRPKVERLILAGGLTTANVTEAIRVVRPDAVDVCSGVERAPGRKDANAVRSFVAAVRAG